MDVPNKTPSAGAASRAELHPAGVGENLPAKRLDHAPIPSHLEAFDQFYPSSNMTVHKIRLTVHKIRQNGGVNGKNHGKN